jgi:hypothetical protein
MANGVQFAQSDRDNAADEVYKNHSKLETGSDADRWPIRAWKSSHQCVSPTKSLKSESADDADCAGFFRCPPA